MNRAAALRLLISAGGLVALWYFVVWVTDAPHFMLPTPLRVAQTLLRQWDIIAGHALVTLAEILAGLVFGAVFGAATALLVMAWPPGRRWLLPVLVISQAVPVFAIAPLLVLWMGFGVGSKIAMAAIIIFFPVTTAFYDGL